MGHRAADGVRIANRIVNGLSTLAGLRAGGWRHRAADLVLSAGRRASATLRLGLPFEPPGWLRGADTGEGGVSRLAHELGTESAFGVVAVVNEMGRRGAQVARLSIGDTGELTSYQVIDRAAGLLRTRDAKVVKYTPGAGLMEVREAIAAHFSKVRKANFKPEQVVVLPGCKPAIYLAVAATCNPGDTVVAMSPGFPMYQSVPALVGADYVPWTPVLDGEKIRFVVSDLRKILDENPRAKIVIINSPSNPIGCVLPPEDLREIVHLCRQKGVWIYSDEPYDRILFGEDKTYHSVHAVSPEIASRIAIIGHGVSKTYNMTGWRAGFVIAPEGLARVMERLAINIWSCPPGLNAQIMRAIYSDLFTMLEGEVAQDVAEYERKAQYVYDALRKVSGIQIARPEGAFYAFPILTDEITASPGARKLAAMGLRSDRGIVKSIAAYLLLCHEVAVLPGVDFGPGGPVIGERGMRVSYAGSGQEVETGIASLIQGLEDLKGGTVRPVPDEYRDLAPRLLT